MTDQLQNYVANPRSAEANFALALSYENDGHFSAAAGFYIRAAVHTANTLLSYESLLRLGNCFTKLGGRTYRSKGIFLRAISLLPERPEAYFLLSHLYEVDKEWQEAYTFAVMGAGAAYKWSGEKLRTNVGYPGAYAFTFERAVAGWWIGLYDESLHLLRQLKKNQTMLPEHVSAVQENLNRLAGTVHHDPLTYHSSMYERLRVKFPGARDIKRNYSQMCQDMFVLTMLNGKRNGAFLEIGCGDPVDGSNTKLLEEFGWKGISIDVVPDLSEKFSKQRTCSFIAADATQMDFNALVQHDYDYLQIDIEPPLASLQTLLKIPLDKNRFAVITFEHDDYRSSEIKERSRAYLRSHGYVMVVGDIAINQYESCEDWWVHPDLVDPKIVSRMLESREGTKKADDYMLLKSGA